MREGFQFFGGIDFSGAKEPLSNLWTAVGRADQGRLVMESVRPHAFRADLCGFVTGGWRAAAGADEAARILWGADFPFGLPAAAAVHLCSGPGGRPGWSDVVAWVADRPADEVRGAVPDAMRTPRATDTGGAMGPFDLRLYKQTVEGLRWLHEVRDQGDVAVCPQQPRAGAEATLIEVYPSSTVQELGLPRRRAPSRPGEVRARAAALRTFVRFADPGCEALAVTLEDAWDATIACITAWLARDDLDQPFRASPHPREQLELEGWIYRPPEALPSR